MSDQFVGEMVAYKDEEQSRGEKEILFEVTEVTGENVEIAFDIGKERIYIRLPLSEVVARAIAFHQD